MEVNKQERDDTCVEPSCVYQSTVKYITWG